MLGPNSNFSNMVFLIMMSPLQPPAMKSPNGIQSNRFSLASLVLAPPFLCISLINVWKSSLMTSPSNTMLSDIWSRESSNCLLISGKLDNSLPFLENSFTSSLSTSQITITLTPSNLGSTIISPTIFFSCLAESVANIQSNTGTLYLLNLFTVLCVIPHLRSLIRILRYQSFHCSFVALPHRSSTASLMSFPVRVLSSICLATRWKTSQLNPAPSLLDVGTFCMPNVLNPSNAIHTPSKKSLLSASLSRLIMASFFSLLLSASISCSTVHGFIISVSPRL